MATVSVGHLDNSLAGEALIGAEQSGYVALAHVDETVGHADLEAGVQRSLALVEHLVGVGGHDLVAAAGEARYDRIDHARLAV